MSRMGTQPQTQFGNTQTSNQAGTYQQTGQAGTTQNFRERVAQRAYEKWVKGGRRQGTELQDWFEAEAEVMAEQGWTGNTAAGGGYYR